MKRIRVKKEQSARVAAVQIDPAQLALFREEILRTLTEKPVSRTLAEISADWLPRKLLGLASARTFEGRVRLHLLPTLGHHSSATLKPRMVEDLMNTLRAKGLSAQTVNHIRDAGRQMINDAIRNEEWSTSNPFELVKKLPVPESEFDVLTRDEAAVLLWWGVHRRWRPFFALALYMGQRLGTIRFIRRADVDLERKLIDFRVTKQKKRNMAVPIPDELVPYLQEALTVSSDWLFTGKRGGQTGGSRTLNRELHRALAHVEITRQGRRPNFTFHGLRRISSCLHQEAGCHPWVVSKTLGHSQTSLMLMGSTPENMTSRRYTTFSEDFIRRELNKLSLKPGAQPPDLKPEPKPPALAPKPPAAVARNGRAKLTEEQVREILRLAPTMRVSELALKFGVSCRAITFIKKGLR